MIRWWLATLILALSTTVRAQSVPPGFKAEAYGDPLPAGTSLACAPDGRVFVGQLGGTVRVIKNGALL